VSFLRGPHLVGLWSCPRKFLRLLRHKIACGRPAVVEPESGSLQAASPANISSNFFFAPLKIPCPSTYVPRDAYNDLCVVQETVQNRRGGGHVAQELAPILQGAIFGHRRATSLSRRNQKRPALPPHLASNQEAAEVKVGWIIKARHSFCDSVRRTCSGE
jgi:hypothetical protein